MFNPPKKSQKRNMFQTRYSGSNAEEQKKGQSYDRSDSPTAQYQNQLKWFSQGYDQILDSRFQM